MPQEDPHQRLKRLPRPVWFPRPERRCPPEMNPLKQPLQRSRLLPRLLLSLRMQRKVKGLTGHQGTPGHPLMMREMLRTIQIRGTRLLHQMKPMWSFGRHLAPHRKTSPKSLKNHHRLREQRKGLHHQQRLQKRRRLPLRPSLRSRWSHCPHYRSRQILTCH